jgi:hypothetical protein
MKGVDLRKNSMRKNTVQRSNFAIMQNRELVITIKEVLSVSRWQGVADAEM